MFASLSLPALILIFLIGAIVVWFAGAQLSRTADIMDDRFGLGQALGGLVFLAIATNLPELAIVCSASLSHQPGIAVGNILGGIAIQTVVLVIVDGFGARGRGPLTYKAASLDLVLEGVLLLSVLAVVVMGTQLPKSAILFSRLAPGDLLIAVIWLVSLWLVGKAHNSLPWQRTNQESDEAPPQKDESQKRAARWSTPHVIVIFVLAALATLLAGIALEESGNVIADHIGLSGVLFGSTILAASTALPEVVTGLAAARFGTYDLAVSDIFGGNTFLPVLFLFATFLSGQSVLPLAGNTNLYLVGLGGLLTTVYLCGLLFCSKKQYFNLGIDSILVLVLYVVGIGGLFLIARP